MFIDVLSLCLSFLGVYDLLLYVRYLLPRNVAPLLSAVLDEAQKLLGRAEEIGAVPPRSGYKYRLDRYEDLRILDCPNISYSDVVRCTSLR